MHFYVLFLNIVLFIFNETSAYQTRRITKLCPPKNPIIISSKSYNTNVRHVRDVRLDEGNQSAALILFSSSLTNFIKYDKCRFRVVATNADKHKNRGLFVSIRRLNLRKSHDTDECIDYVQLKFDTEKTSKFCGQLNASIDDVHKIFIGEGGSMIEVELHFNKYLPLKYVGDKLEFELVFTANQDCDGDNEIRCYDNKCISKSLENDGINNCPPPNCKDEGDRCPQLPKKLTNNTANVRSVLTSFIFTLVGVGSYLLY